MICDALAMETSPKWPDQGALDPLGVVREVLFGLKVHLNEEVLDLLLMCELYVLEGHTLLLDKVHESIDIDVDGH